MEVPVISSSKTIIGSLSSHIGLPPQLPGKKDKSPEIIGSELIKRSLAAVNYVTNIPGIPFLDEWVSLRRSLELTQSVNTHEGLLKESIMLAVRELSSNEFVLLHIIEQNAGIMIRKQSDENGVRLIFEVSEASPMSQNVLESSNALIIDFPSHAVSLPLSVYYEYDLEKSLVAYLAQASGESVKRFAPFTNKAQSHVYESRDTVNPIMMTGILITVLKSLGEPCNPFLLRKRVRDDVCWDGTGSNPWRRSAMWLMLRVAVERHLRGVMGPDMGRIQYKLLMCLFHSRFLSEYANCSDRNEEVLHHLSKKLVMRIDKLYRDEADMKKSELMEYSILRDNLDETFSISIQTASRELTKVSNLRELSQSRDIRNVQRYAHEPDFKLKMTNSRTHIEKALRSNLIKNKTAGSKHDSDHWGGKREPIPPFAKKYLKLAELESDMKHNRRLFSPQNVSNKTYCSTLIGNIENYLDVVGSSYDKDARQMSEMLLLVLDYWVELDKAMIGLQSLLKDYSPGIPEEITNVLLLTNMEDLERLRKIQAYLMNRTQHCKKPPVTIFEQPSERCYAVQYYDRQSKNSAMHKCLLDIERDAGLKRQKKKKELSQMNDWYRDYQQQESAIEHDHPNNQKKNDGCQKCKLMKEMKRKRITAHEWPLPNCMVATKTLIFELHCPEEFSSYRDISWNILASLASFTFKKRSDTPRVIFRNYKVLAHYSKTSRVSKFTLASTTKPFGKTHYQVVRLPAREKDVLVQNGANFRYYDSTRQIWSDQLEELSFAHHCNFFFPDDSPYLSLIKSSQLLVYKPGPSSYSIIAGQTNCPKGLLAQELMAVQSLFLGYEQRWPQILIELGSSNINFSSESIMIIMNLITSQVGPADKGDVRGIIHRVFNNHSFCGRLIYWIDWLLDDISSNLRRREVYYMEILITLSLRVFDFGIAKYRQKCITLVEKARAITSKWLSKLNEDIRNADTAEGAIAFNHYATWAALLCRRTFIVFAGSEKIPKAHMITYIDSSISLQLTLSDCTSLHSNLFKSVLIRDLKIAWSIRDIIRQSLDLSILVLSISKHIPSLSHSMNEENSKFVLLKKSRKWWLVITTQYKTETKSQDIALNMLTGNLLVDWRPMGSLPSEWKNDENFKRLFGTEAMRTWPSKLHGMDFQSYRLVENHEIHFGSRNGVKIIQALTSEGTLELLPQDIFSGDKSQDLPKYLVNNCVHWLNVNRKRIEIRPVSNPWRYKDTDWNIDLKSYVAMKILPDSTNIRLIDPHSLLFREIANIFKYFESPDQLVVYQTSKCSIRVRLPRFDLSFFVNQNNRLECLALSSEIDWNQDAGTWYGLKSKIVLRGIARVIKSNSRCKIVPSQTRSILALTGELSINKNGPHVEIKVSSIGNYAHFAINNVLGRLETTDPSNQYLKAYYHAITSCLHPDPLTGRTGIEEAFHCLGSALCRPAVPLSADQILVLEKIACLTPRREYYPKHMKRMQITYWNPDMHISMQHDGFRTLVKKILNESEQLVQFFGDLNEDQKNNDNDAEELTQRSLARRIIYDRPISGISSHPVDLNYTGRDKDAFTPCLQNVDLTTQLIKQWKLPIRINKRLSCILQEWSNFEGFSHQFTSPLLSDIVAINLSCSWGSLVNSMRNTSQESRYRLMFFIGTIAFDRDVDMDAIMTLLAFAISDKLKLIEPPTRPSYEKFKVNEKPTFSNLLELVKPFFGLQESNNYFFTEANTMWLEATDFVNNLIDQWPCYEPLSPRNSQFIVVNSTEIMNAIHPEWKRLYHNYELSTYLSKVQPILSKISTKNGQLIIKSDTEVDEPIQQLMKQGPRRVILPTLSSNLLRGITFNKLVRDLQRHNDDVTSEDLFSNDDSDHCKVAHAELNATNKKQSATATSELGKIILDRSTSPSNIEEMYTADLAQSLQALNVKLLEPKKITKKISNLHVYINRARRSVQAILEKIANSCDKLMPRRSVLLKKVGLWPYIGPISLLENLRSTTECKFGRDVRQVLVIYGVSITKLQRLNRIREARFKYQKQRLTEELSNPGHENWDPISHTDWLLLEIDSDLLLRAIQVDVARETISPASGNNSVLQMNMGQGKTSCIMPMAAAAIADGKNLMRVIVPRALLAQNMQLLQVRLGGLVGRTIKHIPFSRRTAKYPNICSLYLRQLKNIQESHGVMVTLPEHMLSFKLSGQQALSDGNILEAREMFEAQNWISRKSRDIIDECDEILSLRTQLIYPSGTQKIVDGHPYRWETTQKLLQLVALHADCLERFHSQGIKVTRRVNGSFPFICLINDSMEDILTSRLVDTICSGQFWIIPNYSAKHRSAMKEFISKPDIEEFVENKIGSLTVEKPVNRQVIYLLRGLLAHGLLITSLKKRWNVQYGLHPSRDPIAVPFHAKGCPSELSEWGHPDVAIILTCLAFYYEGLSLPQLHETMKRILQADDPVLVYDKLIQGSILPQSLSSWKNINVEDMPLVKDLWQYLRYSVNIINYFLNIFVFPKFATQFEQKLSATSWDIPLYILDKSCNKIGSTSALTTGFSGTNDWKRLLPLNISQQDLKALSHTNAEVLTYLLQERNKGYVQAADCNGNRLSERELLREISKRKITVLIDAGAQIMEMDNLNLVKAWLETNLDAPAAFYFNKENKPRILYRGGRQVSFYSSTFSENLRDCLVYLDQAHTRGTDLKLESDARGALTIGPHQTKDHTVQAAMRLRQLGSTQSLMFFAPPEVHQSIISLQKKTSSEILTSYDVVSWLLKQTCIEIELLLPSFYIQGVDFCRRTQAGLTYSRLFSKKGKDRVSFLSTIRQKEASTLGELYGTKKNKQLVSTQNWDSNIVGIFEKLKVQCKGMLDSENDYYASAMQEVEQEREETQEDQVVRQSQKPPHHIVLKFPGLHHDIQEFLKYGKVKLDASGYEPAFDYIGKTLLGKKYGINKEATSQKLFVSTQFGLIVRQESKNKTDHLHRPVNWVLWSAISEVGIVIIPEELEIILRYVRENSSNVHILSYAAPVTRKMLIFNDFDHYNIPSMPAKWCAPSWLRIEVGILAGRKYFDYSEYTELIDFLGVQQVKDRIVENLSELSEVSLGSNKKVKRFTSKPLCFLRDWIAQRGHGQDFAHTPMGHICQGLALPEQNSICTRLERTGTNLHDDETFEVVFDSTAGQQEDQNDIIGFEIIPFEQELRDSIDYSKDDNLLQFSSSESDEE